MELDLREIRAFSLDCQQSDLSKGTVMTKNIGHIFGVDIVLTYTEGKYGLTPEEEKMIEEMVGKRWDAAHAGSKPGENK